MNKAFRHALRDIFGDGALIIFMVIVPIVYPIVYALIYNTEAASREVACAAMCTSGEASRRFKKSREVALPDLSTTPHTPPPSKPPRP